jgi:hypothetical protein
MAVFEVSDGTVALSGNERGSPRYPRAEVRERGNNEGRAPPNEG